MLSITPVRERISERFPVASFVVTVPPERYFEVACATDPRLFRADQRHRRTASNFATSRLGGLLRAPAGQATYIIPPSQLRRFAGAQRLYYAVGSYRGARNEDPLLTLPLDHVERAPSIQISPDFTGRSLDRGKIGVADQRYGSASAAPLVWGGDDVSVARAPLPATRYGNAAVGVAAPAAAALDYDDGFDPALWSEPQHAGDEDHDDVDIELDDGADLDGETYGSPSGRGFAEPAGFEDAREMVLGSAEPPGYEHAPPVAQHQHQHQHRAAFGGGEPAGYEDIPAMTRALGSRAPAPAARYGGGAPAAAMPVAAPRPSHHHERYGSVATSAHRAPVYGGAAAEVAGYEDIPDLVRHLGPRRRARYGNGADAVPAPVAPVAPLDPLAPAAAVSSRFPDYSEELGDAEPLPEMGPEAGPDDAFTPTDPRHRLRIIGRAALAETGSDRYRAVSVDAATGVGWGYVQLSQLHGGLGHALRVCLRRDRDAYIRMFGEHNAAPAADDLDTDTLPAGNLLRVTNAPDRMARLAPVLPPVAGAPIALTQPVWLEALRAAGDLQAFQEAQREVADRRLYLPFLDFLRWLGIRSVRGHAMFVDRAIQMGGGAAARWVARVAGPVRTQTDLRVALAHLGHADVRSFQASPTVPGMTIPTADGVFGALTHAALTAALRHAVESPLPLRSEPEMLAALVADAAHRADTAPHWRIAAQRLRALADDPTLVGVPQEPTR
jgi:hypothetical protein